jgi:hypothetical protein
MEHQHKEIVEHYVRSYNDFDIAGMTKNLAEHVVFENMSNGTVDLRTEGLAAFKEQAGAAKSYFTHRQQTIESWDISDSMISIAISYQAILAIDFPNGMKVGDTLSLTGTSTFEFENSQIVRITDKS